MASIHQEQENTTLPCLLAVSPNVASLKGSEHSTYDIETEDV